MRVLSLDDLRDRGIRFSRQHLHRLIAVGKFPKPIKIGENKNAWIETEIDQYLTDRIAARDKAA